MKKCVLINCFASSNEMRVEPIRDVLRKNGYSTIYISSDFHHAKKEYVELPKEIKPIHVKAYKKNMSILRLYSHYMFSKNVYKYLIKTKPDLVYIKFPPNTLVKTAYDYKQSNSKSKIILDIFDLWPESLPIPEKTKFIISPITNIWKFYRDKYMVCADLILTECNMYQILLKEKLKTNAHTLYLTKKDIDYKCDETPNDGILRLCYLGGINNLIDIEAVKHTIEILKNTWNVTLDIIGDGQNKDKLLRVAKDNGCSVTFHGVIYDDIEKYKIMRNCDLGINLMKDTSVVALTLKSIEYFRAGLGIINNIKYDTKEIVKEYDCGVEIEELSRLKNKETINIIKRNARKTYLELFEYNSNKEKFNNILKEI